jgi:hypothetical protein
VVQSTRTDLQSLAFFSAHKSFNVIPFSSSNFIPFSHVRHVRLAHDQFHYVDATPLPNLVPSLPVTQLFLSHHRLTLLFSVFDVFLLFTQWLMCVGTHIVLLSHSCPFGCTTLSPSCPSLHHCLLSQASLTKCAIGFNPFSHRAAPLSTVSDRPTHPLHRGHRSLTITCTFHPSSSSDQTPASIAPSHNITAYIGR